MNPQFRIFAVKKRMEKIAQKIFSMRAVALGLFLFLAAIGTATFIESMHGVQAAKIVVYNATWFTVLLAYLSVAMMYNIWQFRMWRREKWALLLFHASFLVIMTGAAVTRYTGFEGIIRIPEGESVDYMFSAEPHLGVYIRGKGTETTQSYKTLMSDWSMVDNSFEHEINHQGTPVNLSYVNFISNAIDTLEFDQSINTQVLDIVVGQMKSNYLESGDSLRAGNLGLYFTDQPKNGVSFKFLGEKCWIYTNQDLRWLPMTKMQEARKTGAEIPDSSYKIVPKNIWIEAQIKTLYQAGTDQFVLKNILYHTRKTLVKSPIKNRGSDYLTVKVSTPSATKTVTVKGGMGMIPSPTLCTLGDLKIQLEYGSLRIPLPFSIYCKDFKLINYPGSESPSSFESYIRIDDARNDTHSERHIFMNHVTDYDGYRFFQSSYEADNPTTPQNEEATVLSVNHDTAGTNITYLGYLLMGLGMILSLFAPKGRFRLLNQQLRKLKTNPAVILFVVLSCSYLSSNAQTPVAQVPMNRVISVNHSEKVARLLVQEQSGRIIPLHTLCDQLLRKIFGSNHYEDLNAVQTILAMHMYPEYWMEQNIIAVPSAVREPLGLAAKCRFKDLIDTNYAFKFEAQYTTARKKAEKNQNEFEKKLIKFAEKFHVFDGIIRWQFMRILPKIQDPTNTWYVPLSPQISGAKDSANSRAYLSYFASLHESSETADFSKADEQLEQLISIQRTLGKEVVPSETQVSVEILSNKLEIFKTVQRIYISFGLLLLIIYILSTLVKSTAFLKWMRYLRILLTGLAVLTFIYHATGLGFRWYISGHAPWSNGYEAIIFIAWVTVLTGWIFLRKIDVVVPVALILASMMLLVSEMNLLDPEITPLVPVLKSYWLMIHVAIITSSYAFLGLSFILGLLNLCFYIFLRKSNHTSLNQQINQITIVSEMTMTIGVFMLTIGTFLGGVWANESWGRYWGWDPKETWALVSILVYAIILHLRFIPGLKSPFVFNLWSFWGYSAILFTYFGVNFMLVGLHSYAQGDGLGTFPDWLIVTILLFIALSILSYLRYKISTKNT